MIYKIIYHKPGIIKIEVPVLKKLPLKEINKIISILSCKYNNCAIREIRANPLTGRVILLYNQGQIDIISFLKEVSKDDFFNNL